MTDPFTDFDVRILRLEPGDIIAIRSVDDLSREQADMLREQAEKAFGRTVVVLSGDLDLVVVREAEPI